MGNSGPPLVPGCTLPLAPGFARGTPFLGFFPGPPGVGFPWPALAQEDPNLEECPNLLGIVKSQLVAPRHEIWTFGHFRVMVKKRDGWHPDLYDMSHEDLSTVMEMDGGNLFNQ